MADFVMRKVFRTVFLCALLMRNGSLVCAQRTESDAIGEDATAVDEMVVTIFEDSSGRYWFGGGPRGLYRYDGEALVLFSVRDGLCGHSILGIQEDDDGNIYLDTTKGVSRFDGKRFTTLKVIEHQTSEQGWRLSSEDLWFRSGWDKPGPCRYDGEVLHQLKLPEHARAAEFHDKYPSATWSPYGLYALYRDRQGAVWCGTAALGVCRYDGESVRWLYEEHLTRTPTGGDFGFRSIIADRNGDYWFCNSRFRYDIPRDGGAGVGTELKYTREPGMGYINSKGEVEFPFFLSAVEDGKGNLWLASYDDGVWKNDGQKLVHFPVKYGDAAVLLSSLYWDRRGNLWLATQNAGVWRFNGRSFEPFLPTR